MADGFANLLVRVVPEGDEVVVVGERQDAFAVLLGHREQVLQDARNLGKKVTIWKKPN